MKIRNFEGQLTHQNPVCTMCNGHCYSLYIGGRKDKISDVFYCKKCKIAYVVSEEKRCDLMGDGTK
jgi:hypothetical protein